jgi:AraC-like DNA-binding protein
MRGSNGSNANRPDTPTSTGAITRLAVALAEEKGADVESLLKESGLLRERIDDPSIRLEVQNQIKFLELVAKAIDDDFLGFHLSQRFDLRELGLPYYVLASSQTIDEALGHAARYSSVVNDGIRLTLRESRKLSIVFEYVSVARHLDQHQIEFWFAALIRICRQITNRRLIPDSVSFVHRRKPSSELSAFFGCDIRFGSDVDEAVFSPSIRDVAVVSGDPYLNQLLIKYCEEALAYRTAGQRSFAPTVENEIALLMPHGKAQAAEVARRLGLSQKTLARRLWSEGLRFASVRQRLRCDLAKRHLADKGLSISEIAWLLGYRDVGAFTNAFKRWTGRAPRTFRQQLN